MNIKDIVITDTGFIGVVIRKTVVESLTDAEKTFLIIANNRVAEGYVESHEEDHAWLLSRYGLENFLCTTDNYKAAVATLEKLQQPVAFVPDVTPSKPTDSLDNVPF